MSATNATDIPRAAPVDDADFTPLSAGWRVVTTVIMWATFLQAITAGRILTGDGWARTVHRGTGMALVAGVLVAGVVALATQRHIPRGKKMGTLLVVIAVGLVVQFALGTMAVEGKEVLWIHIPVGVGLIGMMDTARLTASGKVR